MSPKKFIWPAFFLVFLFISAGLIAYAWWVYQIERGNLALRRGDAQMAEALYQVAEAPFRKFPALAYLVRDEYQALFFTRISALYNEQRYQEVIDNLEERATDLPFLAESGQYSFWSGNALLHWSAETNNPEESLNALKASLAAYQKGLAAQPDDWDLKYNYELVRQVLSQKERGRKEEKIKSILEKTRPTTDPSKGGLAPEKRG